MNNKLYGLHAQVIDDLVYSIHLYQLPFYNPVSLGLLSQTLCLKQQAPLLCSTARIKPDEKNEIKNRIYSYLFVLSSGAFFTPATNALQKAASHLQLLLKEASPLKIKRVNSEKKIKEKDQKTVKK